jgi:predicted nucleotidyltransferase component of viral defense system
MPLSEGELYGVADAFGVDLEQVRRDYAISHILAAISRRLRNQLTFYGGTALSRTWLIDGRLSEDVDLLVHEQRRQVGAALAAVIEHDVAPACGPVAWSKDPASARDAELLSLQIGANTVVGVQLADADSRPHWPTVETPIHQRYADAPPATLRVPTPAAAAAMKLAAWYDRRASRDLFDMWQMALRGLITPAALNLFVTFGPTGHGPGDWVFASPPSERNWTDQLAHQTRLKISAGAAAEAVKLAWETAMIS